MEKTADIVKTPTTAKVFLLVQRAIPLATSTMIGVIACTYTLHLQNFKH